jgi:hypothetical protein
LARVGEQTVRKLRAAEESCGRCMMARRNASRARQACDGHMPRETRPRTSTFAPTRSISRTPSAPRRHVIPSASPLSSTLPTYLGVLMRSRVSRHNVRFHTPSLCQLACPPQSLPAWHGASSWLQWRKRRSTTPQPCNMQITGTAHVSEPAHRRPGPSLPTLLSARSSARNVFRHAVRSPALRRTGGALPPNGAAASFGTCRWQAR